MNASLLIKTTVPAYIKKTGLSLIILFILFAAQNRALKAQNVISDNTVESLELRVALLEQNYYSAINQALGSFFGPDKFYLRIRIKTDISTKSFDFSGPVVVMRNMPNLVLPGLPYLPEESINRITREDPQPEVPTYRNIQRTINLAKIEVIIFADNSLRDIEIDLVHKIVSTIINEDPERGDVIKISKMALPRTQADTGLNTTSEIIPLVDEITDLVFLFKVLMGLFGLLLVILVFTIVQSRKNKPKPADKG